MQWAAAKGLRNLLIEPGRPWQNGTNESFNGKFRDECLAIHTHHAACGRLRAKLCISANKRSKCSE
jgi:putative transposase